MVSDETERLLGFMRSRVVSFCTFNDSPKLHFATFCAKYKSNSEDQKAVGAAYL